MNDLETARAAPATADSGPPNSSCLVADGSRIAQNPTSQQIKSAAAVAQARRGLVCELLHEALSFARVYAETAQTFAEIGDDVGTLYALSNFRAAARAACDAGRQIREIRDGGEA